MENVQLLYYYRHALLRLQTFCARVSVCVRVYLSVCLFDCLFVLFFSFVWLEEFNGRQQVDCCA